jgi:hypothetical protein
MDEVMSVVKNSIRRKATRLGLNRNRLAIARLHVSVTTEQTIKPLLSGSALKKCDRQAPNTTPTAITLSIRLPVK